MRNTGSSARTTGSALCVGDPVTLVPGYSPSTVNYYDAFHVVRDGVVVDLWPVDPPQYRSSRASRPGALGLGDAADGVLPDQSRP